MEKLILSKTHQRIMATLLFVLEQKTENIEHMLQRPPENASYTVEKNLSEQETQALLDTCSELKAKIFDISAKYGINKRKIHQYQYIHTLQSQMWEHVSDAFSAKLNGYGDQLKANAQKVDPDIKELSVLIDKLKL